MKKCYDPSDVNTLRWFFTCLFDVFCSKCCMQNQMELFGWTNKRPAAAAIAIAIAMKECYDPSDLNTLHMPIWRIFVQCVACKIRWSLDRAMWIDQQPTCSCYCCGEVVWWLKLTWNGPKTGRSPRRPTFSCNKTNIVTAKPGESSLLAHPCVHGWNYKALGWARIHVPWWPSLSYQTEKNSTCQGLNWWLGPVSYP